MNKEIEKDPENEPFLQQEEFPPRFPIRYVILFMCCVSVTLAYSMRMNWSVVILSMVSHQNQSAMESDYSSAEGEQSDVFDWDRETQQIILGVFYYGYATTPVIGGWLVGRFGGYSVLLSSMILSSLMMLATPTIARKSVTLLIVNRIIDGFGQGLTFPATFGIIANWSKLNERSTFISFLMSGLCIGGILASYISTWLATSLILGGWPSTFYTYGICSFISACVWSIVGSGDVLSHRWISKYEKNLILESQSLQSQDKKKSEISWKKILTSPPVWSLCVCSIGLEYGYFLLYADIPIFFESILGYNIRTSGLLNISPQIVFFITNMFEGFAADNLVSLGILSLIVTRKLTVCFSLSLSSILLVSMGYIANNATISVIIMTIAFGMYGFAVPAIGANVLDIAPDHSGLIIGIVYSISALSGFFGPAVVGVITETNNTVYEWRIVFWIVAGVQVAGLLTFLFFGSGDVQDWRVKSKTKHCAKSRGKFSAVRDIDEENPKDEKQRIGLLSNEQ